MRIPKLRLCYCSALDYATGFQSTDVPGIWSAGSMNFFRHQGSKGKAPDVPTWTGATFEKLSQATVAVSRAASRAAFKGPLKSIAHAASDGTDAILATTWSVSTADEYAVCYSHKSSVPMMWRLKQHPPQHSDDASPLCIFSVRTVLQDCVSQCSSI